MPRAQQMLSKCAFVIISIITLVLYIVRGHPASMQTWRFWACRPSPAAVSTWALLAFIPSSGVCQDRSIIEYL